MKRQDLVLDAWELLADLDTPHHLFLIGGAHPGEDSYADLILQRARDTANVTALGRREDVPALLASADIAVLATDAEPFGLAVIEAMAAGVCAVASRSAGPAEIIADGVDGVLFTPGSPADLASALRRLLCDDELRSRIAESGLETVRASYTIERQVAQLVDAYLDA